MKPQNLKSKKKFYHILEALVNISSTVKFTILSILAACVVYSLVPLIFIPILIYRQVVKLIVQWWDPNYGPILEGMDALQANQDAYGNPMVVLCPYFPVYQKIENKKQILEYLNDKIIKPNLYPNLKQKIVKKFGYYFWYNVKNFNLEDHVIYLHPECPEKPVTTKEVRNATGYVLGSGKFDSRRSPWEIIIVPNYFDENKPHLKSCIILRVNHSLMDGYSMIKFMQTSAKVPWKTTIETKIKNEKASSWERFKKMFAVLATGPYHVMNMMFFQNDKNEFLNDLLSKNKDSYTKGEAWNGKEETSRRVTKERLKNIKDKHNVGMNSLLVSLVVDGAIRFMRSRENCMIGGLPSNFYLMMTVPIPHPNVMSNYWTFARMPVKVEKDHNSEKILQSVHKQLESIKNSVAPMVSFLTVKLFMGMLPVWMLPGPLECDQQTIVLSSMPGPGKKIDVFGYEYDEFGFGGCPTYGSAFVCCWQTFKDDFWVDVCGFRTLFPTQKDLHDMEDCVFNGLKELENEKDE